MFNAFFSALEREKHTNMELEKQRLSAEKENARQRERSRQIKRQKNMITRGVRIKRGYGRTDEWRTDGRTDEWRTDGRTDGYHKFLWFS